MNLEILNDLSNLINNDNLTEKFKLIDILVDLRRYKEAYFKLAIILEYINILFITKVLNIPIQNSNIINICNIYSKKDSELANKMIDINGDYNLVSNLSYFDIDDVEFLATSIYDIYDYMKNNYKPFL